MAGAAAGATGAALGVAGAALATGAVTAGATAAVAAGAEASSTVVVTGAGAAADAGQDEPPQLSVRRAKVASNVNLICIGLTEFLSRTFFKSGILAMIFPFAAFSNLMQSKDASSSHQDTE